MRTKRNEYTPVGIVEMVFESVVSAAWSHFARATGGLRVLRPRSFNLLAADTTDALHEMQGVLIVAFLLVGAKVVLRNGEAKLTGATGKSDPQVRRHLAKTLQEPLCPLTHDIVRYNETGNLAECLKRSGNDVVHIAVSTEELAWRVCDNSIDARTARPFVDRRRSLGE